MPVSRTRAPLVTMTTASLLALSCGTSEQYPQTTFEPVTEFGRLLNSLFANTFWWTIGILVLVEVLLLVFVFRYRARPGAPEPRHIHGHVGLEITWTLIPAVIVLFIAVPTIRGVFATQQEASADALVVEVIGHQWWWEFRYPELGVVTANELVLPTHREVDLRMHSADVVHSFWIPRIGGKRDVNPQPRPTQQENARINHLVFTIEQPGYYAGQCAEFCGESHALMRAAVVAMTAEDFATWTAGMSRPVAPAAAADAARDTASAPASATAPGQTAPAAAAPAPSVAQVRPPVSPTAPTGAPAPGRGVYQELGPVPPGSAQRSVMTGQPPLEETGKQLFATRVCSACHTISGTTAQGVLGPNLTRFGTRRTLGAGVARNTLENLQQWLERPQDMKPGVLMPGAQQGAAGMPATGLTPDEIRAVAAYLKSLK